LTACHVVSNCTIEGKELERQRLAGKMVTSWWRRLRWSTTFQLRQDHAPLPPPLLQCYSIFCTSCKRHSISHSLCGGC